MSFVHFIAMGLNVGEGGFAVRSYHKNYDIRGSRESNSWALVTGGFLGGPTRLLVQVL